jgi:hypothetical protein
VVLRWKASFDGGIAFFDVYREDENDSSLTKITQESLFAKNEFLDTNVRNGVTYQYFLGVWEGEGQEQTLFGPVSVTYLSPLAVTSPRLAVWPNPSTGSIKVAFAVEKDNVPFRLAVLDVSGRTVGEIGSGMASIGITSLLWNPVEIPGRPLSPGIYFVLLEMDGKRFEKKVVFLK